MTLTSLEPCVAKNPFFKKKLSINQFNVKLTTLMFCSQITKYRVRLVCLNTMKLSALFLIGN